MALHALPGAALGGVASRRGARIRCAASSGAQRNAGAAGPPPPAVRQPGAAPPPASIWDSLGSSTAERERNAVRRGAAPPPPPPGSRATPTSRRRARDGAPAPEEDEETALGWKVIETREGSDDGDDGGTGGRAGGVRSLPAEMRCFDRAKIYVKAGDGGMGATAFRREAQVSMGGPSGGNGGDGGAVWIVGDAARNSLMCFRKTVHFRAGNGQNGEGKNCYGRHGDDVTISVPLGTLVKDAETGKVLAEVLVPDQPRVVLRGGRGGRGNASFKSNRNRAPLISEKGEVGVETWLALELQVVADVGIVGMPNAGKSTLLAALSSAKPKIASYAFTTLVPNLGVCEQDYTTTVFADIPGLVEGASMGVGLGHTFLQHCLRCRVLVHLLDGAAAGEAAPGTPSGERGAAAVIGAFHAIQTELAAFSPELIAKPQVVVLNKLDLPAARRAMPELLEYFTKLQLKRSAALPPGTPGVKAAARLHVVSAATGEGVTDLVRSVRSVLAALPPPPVPEPLSALEARKPVAADVAAEREGDLSNFSIERDGDYFIVVGAALERFVQMTNWEFFESVQRFSFVMKKVGVWEALRKAGVKEGDPVVIGTMEMAWEEEDDEGQLYDNWRRSGLGGPARGARHWPNGG